MLHLSIERLAALIDEQPTAAELSHLTSCATCMRERRAYEAVLEMSRSGMRIGQPLTSWNKLAPALKRDGVIESGRAFGRRAVLERRWIQVAAAVLLVVGGAAAGRFSAGASLSAVKTSDAVALVAEQPVFSTVAEARAVAQHSQNIYQASLTFIASHDSLGQAASTPAAIKTRLATLNQVSEIAGAALEDAPYDSVINTIYMAARGQRAASMRQLNAASTRLMGY